MILKAPSPRGTQRVATKMKGHQSGLLIANQTRKHRKIPQIAGKKSNCWSLSDGAPGHLRRQGVEDNFRP